MGILPSHEFNLIQNEILNFNTFLPAIWLAELFSVENMGFFQLVGWFAFCVLLSSTSKLPFLQPTEP